MLSTTVADRKPRRAHGPRSSSDLPGLRLDEDAEQQHVVPGQGALRLPGDVAQGEAQPAQVARQYTLVIT